MKTEFHLAYKTSFNFPVHISCRDSVRAVLNDDIRLISMSNSEFPKLRGRMFVNKQYDVVNTYQFTAMGGTQKHTVENIVVKDFGMVYNGFLVDGKYFFTEMSLNFTIPLEVMFAKFEDIGVVPRVWRDWNWDYMTPNPAAYMLFERDETDFRGVEQTYEIHNYQHFGIECLADLIAQSWKFQWSHKDLRFEAVTDEYELTRRLRKPWMSFLCQMEYGEQPHTTADMQKVIMTLVQRSNDEELKALLPAFCKPIDMSVFERLNERQVQLNRLMDAYNSPHLLKTAEDFDSDPFFQHLQNYRGA